MLSAAWLALSSLPPRRYHAVLSWPARGCLSRLSRGCLAVLSRFSRHPHRTAGGQVPAYGAGYGAGRGAGYAPGTPWARSATIAEVLKTPPAPWVGHDTAPAARETCSSRRPAPVRPTPGPRASAPL